MRNTNPLYKRGGGCACTKVHLMQRNKTVPNNALLARRTEINHTNKRKTPPLPNRFLPLNLCIREKKKHPSQIPALMQRDQNARISLSTGFRSLKFRGKKHELCRVGVQQRATARNRHKRESSAPGRGWEWHILTDKSPVPCSLSPLYT